MPRPSENVSQPPIESANLAEIVRQDGSATQVKAKHEIDAGEPEQDGLSDQLTGEPFAGLPGNAEMSEHGRCVHWTTKLNCRARRARFESGTTVATRAGTVQRVTFDKAETGFCVVMMS